MSRVRRKYIIFFAAQVILLLLLLPGCFEQEAVVYSFYGEDVAGAAIQADGFLQYAGEPVRLSPGIYQVRATTRIPEGSHLFLQMNPLESNYNTLRGNGVAVFAGQEYSDFEFYVLDTVESAYIQCDFYGMQTDSLIQLEIYRLNWGSRMLIFLLGAGFLFLDGMLLFREKILAGELGREQQVVVWTLLLCIVISYLPYLTDYFSFGADSDFQILRIESLKESLLHAPQLPIRVQSHWLYDHGYAVSLFYGDLFLFFPAFLRILGFSLMNSYKIFVLAVMAGTGVISYISFYRCVRHRYAALAGTVFYMLAPYRLYNFYNRGAMGEYLAMMFLPLICCGMYLMFTGNVHDNSYKRNKLYLIVGLTGILQSHLLSCEMVGGIIMVTCLILWKKTFRKQTFLQLLQAAVVTLLINSWFWLPLLYMMGSDNYFFNDLVEKNIQGYGTQLAGIVQLFPNMGGAQTGMYRCEPIQMGAAALFMLIGYVLFTIIRRLDKGKKTMVNPWTGICNFLLGWIVVLLIMSTRYFPWDALATLPVLKYLVTAIQFATRLLSPISVLCAMFAAFFVLWLQREAENIVIPGWKNGDLAKGCMAFLLLTALFSGIYHVNDISFERAAIRLYTAENMGSISVVNGEYLLKGTALADYYYHGPLTEGELLWSDYEKEGLRMSLTVENHGSEEQYVELPVTGYKGYAVEADKKEGQQPYIHTRRGSHGDLIVAVPAGYSGRIYVTYRGNVLFRVAEAVSWISIMVIALFAIRNRGKARIAQVKK